MLKHLFKMEVSPHFVQEIFEEVYNVDLSIESCNEFLENRPYLRQQDIEDVVRELKEWLIAQGYEF